jgi:aldose 1-epimerase
MVRLFRSSAIGLVLVALVFAVVGLTGAVASGGKGKHHGHHGHHGHGNLSITSEPFGTAPDGTAVDRYTLDNGKGMVVKILTYGGIVQELWVPDRHRHTANVVLGF